MSYVYKNDQLIRSERKMSKNKAAKTWGTTVTGDGNKHSVALGDLCMAQAKRGHQPDSGKVSRTSGSHAQKHEQVLPHNGPSAMRVVGSLDGAKIFDEASRLGKDAINGTGMSGHLHGTGPSNGVNAGAGTHGIKPGMHNRNQEVSKHIGPAFGPNVARDGKPKRVTVATPANGGAKRGPVLGWKA
jgi:hypothetical protein